MKSTINTESKTTFISLTRILKWSRANVTEVFLHTIGVSESRDSLEVLLPAVSDDKVSDIWPDRNKTTILGSESCLWSQNDYTIQFIHAHFDNENWIWKLTIIKSRIHRPEFLYRHTETQRHKHRHKHRLAAKMRSRRLGPFVSWMVAPQDLLLSHKPNLTNVSPQDLLLSHEPTLWLRLCFIHRTIFQSATKSLDSAAFWSRSSPRSCI